MPKVIQLGGGRPRKPASQKALAGTLRKERENTKAPTLEAVPIPAPPADLTDLEREAWLELKALVDPMQVSTAADVFAFRQMVEDVGMLRSLRKSLGKEKPVYVEDTKAGPQLRVRPEVQTIPTYRKLVMLHMARWGIDPADRARVTTLGDNQPKKDKLAKFRIGAR